MTAGAILALLRLVRIVKLDVPRRKPLVCKKRSQSSLVGEAYADSVNVGLTGLVAALRWVRDNIVNFGGDPNTVMMYGQSGGGSKVTCRMGMPSAAGLFHRAPVRSGGGGNPPGGEQSREFARRVMIELGLGPKDLAALQKMEWSDPSAARLCALGKVLKSAMREASTRADF